MKVEIVFECDHKFSASFVQQSTDDFCPVFNGEALWIVIKEVEEKQQTLEKVRMIAGTISCYLQQQKMKRASLNEQSLTKAFHDLASEELICAFVEGWQLGAYRFDKYRETKSNPQPILQFANENDIAKPISTGQIRAAATCFSRDLMNESPSALNPETFPSILKETFKNSQVEIVVHEKAQLKEMEMNGILTVNRGSKFDPALIELHYEGDATKPLIVLVGKGVTFDTGGISLKKGRNISDMRMDMGGAAAVAGAMKLLAETNAAVNVIGLIQTVENMPGKDAVLPGEVITYKNGLHVQVGNTDAEGRLILADGLIRAGELGATHIVDIATLTGSIVAALGPRLGGIFGEEQLLSTMKAIGDHNGDHVWPMPLVDDYDRTLKSDYADFCNISTQAGGGSITAALFLRRFVPKDSKWIHVDMAGVMDGRNDGYYVNGATGFGARLLADYALSISE